MSTAHSISETCAFTGCDRAARIRGLCRAHYRQSWEGKPLTPLWTSTRIERACPVCQVVFFTWPSRVRTGRGTFCSKDCFNEHQYVPLETRFWRFVNKTDSCWLWTGGHGAYGLISETGNARTLLAHRVSWEIHSGPIPDGLWVLHDCPSGDNPLCVNPAHLWLGTAQDNALDMIAKGRSPRNCGERNGSAKLTWELVRALRARRAEGASFSVLSAEFHIHKMTACDIARGETWNEQADDQPNPSPRT
jgi:hypothetical protein